MKDVILDTNIFIRYFAKDIRSQYEQAKKIFQDIEKENINARVSILVINEIVWIMKKYYEIDPKIYIPKLVQVVLLNNIEIIEADKKTLLLILQSILKTNLDFTDLYLYFIAGKNNVISFDKDFKKMSAKQLS